MLSNPCRSSPGEGVPLGEARAGQFPGRKSAVSYQYPNTPSSCRNGFLSPGRQDSGWSPTASTAVKRL